MKYPIAIVTYKRPIIKTIEYLKGLKNNITIFVENNECKNIIKAYSGYKTAITNTKGISAKRNFILDYYGKGNKIIFCDDDIDFIAISKNKQLAPLNTTQLKEFINHAFNSTEHLGAKLWGVNPVPNPFYMRNTISTQAFCITTFCGVIIDDARFNEKLKFKDDYGFTAENIAYYRKIVRFNNYCVKAEHYNKLGGLSEYRNNVDEKNDCEYLIRKYPYLYRLNPKRENQILMRKIKL